MALNFLNNGYFAGTVGIGTESPSRNLQVKGTANTAIAITSSTANLAQLALGDTDDDNYAQILLDNSTNKLQIQNGGGGIIGNRGITLDSSENVGIGTSSPAKKLHVLNSTNEAQIRLGQSGSGSYDIGVYSGDKFSIGRDADTQEFTLSNGNVGIGTTAPTAKLQVSGKSFFTNDLFTLQNKGIFFNGLDDFSSGIAGIDSGTSVRIFAGGSEKVRVKSTGNVGIGITDPVANLHVESTNDGMTNGINTNQLKLSYGASSIGAGSSLAFGVSSVEKFTGAKIVHERTASNSVGDLTFWTRETGGTSTDYDLTVERMRIDSAGNVGIGDTTPTSKLTILGTSTAASNTPSDAIVDIHGTSTAHLLMGVANVSPFGAWINTDDTAQPLVLQGAGGNVGIGTTNPGQDLEISGQGNVAIRLTSTDSTTSTLQFADSDDVNVGMIQYHHGSNYMSFRTNDNDRVRITSAGNVGIGTTSPVYKLDVRNSGNIFYGGTDLSDNTSVFRLRSNGGSQELLEIKANGNVGIGTASPGAKLDVAGTGNFTGLVSGITPVNAANFVTKAYADGLTPGAGVFLPLDGSGTMSGAIHMGDNDIDAIDELKFSSGTKLGDGGGSSYVDLTYSDSNDGGLRVRDINGQVQGYLYGTGGVTSEFGVLDGSGSWALRCVEDGLAELRYDNAIKLQTGATGVGTATTAGGTLVDGWITTTQANAIDNTTIATTAYVNNKIALIPAGLLFEGTWDARTVAEGGTGNPPSVSPANGQFWIVSVDGSINLSGITDWKVGDWAIYVVAGAGTDGWQKVDNSSVLDGSGTGQTLPLWAGSGTSNTLGNSSITQDASGNQDVGGGITADYFRTDETTDDYSLISRDSAGNASLYVQHVSDSVAQPIARFSYGAANAGGGDTVLQVSKDNSHFLNTKVGIGTASPGTINGVTFTGVGLHVASTGIGRTITSGATWAEYILNDEGAGTDEHAKFMEANQGVLSFGSYDDDGTQRTAVEIKNNGQLKTLYNLVVGDGTKTGGDNMYIQMGFGLDVYVNREFNFDPAASNSAAILLLCAYAPYNNMNGSVQMDRTSGLRHSCRADIVISAGTGTNPIGVMKAMGLSGAGEPSYRLVKFNKVDDTTVYIGLEITNPDGYYENTGAYFNGRVTSTGDSLVSVKIGTATGQAENITVFEENGIHDFHGDVEIEGNLAVSGQVDGDLTIADDLTVGDQLTVGGVTTLNDPLNVDVDLATAYTTTGFNDVGIVLRNQNSDNVLGMYSTIVLTATGWDGTSTGVAQLNVIQEGSNLSNGTFTIKVRDNGSHFEAFRIKHNGNVGIGSIDPVGLLHVRKDQASETKAIIQNNNGAGAGVRLELSVGDPASDDPVVSFNIGNGGADWSMGVDNNDADKFKISGGTDSHNPNLATGNKLTIDTSGNVGIGNTGPNYKLTVSGGMSAGGKVTYTKSAGSLDTTGYAVAGLTTSSNGQSAGFTFTCFGHTGGYQKIVYSCYNGGGTWVTKKVINEGTNQLDVVASANGTTITFTFKSISGTMSYTPRVTVEAVGTAINSTYA